MKLPKLNVAGLSAFDHVGVQHAVRAGPPDSELEGSLEPAPEEPVTSLRVISAKMLVTENGRRGCALRGEAPEERHILVREGSFPPFPAAAAIARESPPAFSYYSHLPAASTVQNIQFTNVSCSLAARHTRLLAVHSIHLLGTACHADTFCL